MKTRRTTVPVLLLNFAHPLTDDQLATLQELLGEPPEQRTIVAHADRSLPLADEARRLVG
jgi:hypothetical protein